MSQPVGVGRLNTMNRRKFVALTGTLFSSFATGVGCEVPAGFPAENDGRLNARPKTGDKTAAPGVRALGLATTRDAMLLIPTKRSQPLPLLVMLHGAGGNA